ncbi:UDP-N-acetylglucosamine 1-carboxyvinyltransferase [Deferribacterales bacterium RsTz2092]|nr:UDP-N-acetylglucosamine 1-carboxyvinyltransferase [Deferribacterales bacterium]
MDKFIINGGNRLNGSVRISGSKNASLPVMAATILANGRHVLSNVPMLNDVRTMSTLLKGLNISISTDSGKLILDNGGGEFCEAPYELVRTMRASILVLGPLLARRGRAYVSLPGGCAIGARPVDLHIAALEKMGTQIVVENGYVDAKCPDGRLHGAEITFKTITVTGTENIMMAATLAEGTTTIYNAAQEPEVVDLARQLRAMGANITGEGTHTIKVEGVAQLAPAAYSIMPDRIEAGTLLCAVAGVGGEVDIVDAPVKELSPIIDALATMGVDIDVGGNRLVIKSSGQLKAKDITTMPHPGFPTDMQAQFMAILSVAEGTSVINETIFENRFMHVAEYKRMGADITISGQTAVVKGVKRLSGAPVMASDLRAGAGLVIAALVAECKSEVRRVYHIDRGYDALEQKLMALGADIRRTKS